MSLKSLAASLFLEGKLPNFIYRFIGKEVANKLDLEETNHMADATSAPTTPAIPFYKSKTVWAAIIGAILGAVQPVSAAFGHPIVIPNWIFEVLAGMGLYSLRTATSNIQ